MSAFPTANLLNNTYILVKPNMKSKPDNQNQNFLTEKDQTQ